VAPSGCIISSRSGLLAGPELIVSDLELEVAFSLDANRVSFLYDALAMLLKDLFRVVGGLRDLLTRRRSEKCEEGFEGLRFSSPMEGEETMSSREGSLVSSSRDCLNALHRSRTIDYTNGVNRFELGQSWQSDG
jgi:hypothetical protein